MLDVIEVGNFLNNNYLIIVGILVILVVIVITSLTLIANKDINKMVRNREISTSDTLLNAMLVDNSNPGYNSNRVLYTFSGEQNPDTYKDFLNILKPFLEKVNDQELDLKVLCLAGPKLMVKDIKRDIKSIHPTIKLLSDTKLGKYLDLYLVKNKRLPYHASYSPLADVGIAKSLHNEASTPMNWTFKNKEEYEIIFEKWFIMLLKKYDARKIYYKENNLYMSNILINDGSINIVDEVMIDETLKNEIFFKKTLWKRVLSYSNKELLDQWQYHKDVTGLAMSNWNPYSESLFTPLEKKILQVV